MRRKSGVKYAVTAILVAMLSVSACQKKSGEKGDESKKAAEAGQAVGVAAVTQMQIAPEIVVAGQVLPQNEAQVYPTTSGLRVMQLLADVGQQVGAGQVLARLDGRQISADSELLAAQVRNARAAMAEAAVGISAAQQNLARTSGTGPKESALDFQSAQIAAQEAKAQYDRAMATNDIGSLSKEEVERRRNAWLAAQARLNAQMGDAGALIQGRQQALSSAKARYESAKSNLELALAQQKQSAIRQNSGAIVAPTSGTITSRNVKVGEITGSSVSPMFTIVSNGVLEVNAEISESELPRLTPGMSAQFSAPDGSLVTGSLRQMPAQIDPQKRTGIAKFTLGATPSVKSGVFLTGKAISATRTITAIPASAIIYDNEGSSVFVVKPDNSVTKMRVTLGQRSGDKVELIMGPAAGNNVVVSGASFLAEGQKINPKFEAQKPAPQPVK